MQSNFAREVGPSGKVIGIDFSDDMLKLANRHIIEEEYHQCGIQKGKY